MTVYAEIPTADAAIAFAAYAEHFPELETLFLRIEATGFPLGVEGRLRVVTVLSRLSALGANPDARTLAEYLVPVLAASAHGQQSIRRIIEDWADPGSAVKTVAEQEARKAAAPRGVRRLEQADRRGAVLAVGLLGLGVIVVLALILFQLISGQSTTAGTAAGTVVTYSQPVVSLDVGLDPFWRRVIEDALSRLGFAAAVLILGLSFVAWRGELKGQLIRQTGQTDFLEPFRHSAEPPRWFRSTDARAAFDRLKRVRLFDTNIIDVQRTVARSIRSGGMPSVVTKHRRELPNYVLLVDRAGRDDVTGIFARTLEGALAEARIIYNRYDFSGGLDRLNPVRGGARVDVVDAEYSPFSVIVSRHAGERLIVIGTGKGFFEVPGFRYDDEGNEILVAPGTPLADTIHVREFSAAALITPTPVSAWGENEQWLHELGFSIYSADVDGVQNLAAQLMAGPDADNVPPPRSPTDEDRFLARLDRDATRLSAAVPPPTADIERLARNLRIWSGSSEVYTLLAAIAAFPKIDSAFTFVLARMVLGKEMDSALFARLSRLPWIRNGHMPDWLRIALVNGLGPGQRHNVQAIQMTILKEVQAETESPVSLLDRLVADFQVARELPRGRLAALISRIQPRRLLSAEERIFFAVLRDHKLDPELDVIRPEAPEIIAEMIEAPERRRQARIRLAVIALAAAVALLQPWIWVALTAVGQAMLATLRALWALLPVSPVHLLIETSLRAVAVIFLSIAVTQWLVSAARREPITFVRLWPILRRPVQRLFDIRFSAYMAATLALTGFAIPNEAPAAAVTDALLFAAGCGLVAWASLVKPEHWWNGRSADDSLQLQVARDPITGTLGTLLVVAIWAVPWFLVVIPSLEKGRADMLAPVACVGVATWVASNALARHWLLGQGAVGPLYRLWIDAGFALLVFLTFAALAGVYKSITSSSVWPGTVPAVLSLASPVVYCVHLKATLGASRVWRSLINGTVAAIAGMFVGGSLVNVVFRPAGIDATTNTILAGAAGGLTYGALVFHRFRRSGHPGGSGTAPLLRALLLGGVLLAAGTGVGTIVQESFAPPKGSPLILAVFVLPVALVVWPMFRLLAPSFGIMDTSMPLWRRIVRSPWWAVPAMFFVGMVWHVSGSPFEIWPFADVYREPDIVVSLWPLALPIAVYFWHRHGAHSFAPLVLGTLPLILRVESPGYILKGTGDNLTFTLGGVWSAIAILFLARLAGDRAFRERVLRRERMSWSEAFLILAMLAASVDLMRFNIAEWVQDPNWSLDLILRIDPSCMLVAVAFVIGASRMPVAPFAFMVIGAWLLHEIVPVYFVLPRDSDTFALRVGDAACVLLVLYGARAWRTYAALRISSAALTDFPDQQLARMKWQGVVLACVAAVMVAILMSGFVPAVAPFGFRQPGAARYVAATLALIFIVGLIGADLLRDRIAVSAGEPNNVFRFAFPTALVPLVAAAIYLTLARAYGNAAYSTLGIGVTQWDSILSDLGSIGFAVCVIAFLAFGITLRAVAERDAERRRVLGTRRSDGTIKTGGEHDVAQTPTFARRVDGTIDFMGQTPLKFLEQEIGNVLSEDERRQIATVGGLVLALLGRIPERGEVLVHPSGVEFEVLDVDPRRIRRLRVRPPPTSRAPARRQE